MPPPPKYSAEQKASFLKMAREMQRAGVTRQVIALRLGVKQTSLAAWLREQTLNLLYPPAPPSMPHNRAKPIKASRLL
ncbi:hypothetical protein [Prosthecobacter sp.]|uniref:hypothetical protein n=1 Tax=Prosthecobacter sp. TaxID=1965333 RepID=UPI00378458F7